MPQTIRTWRNHAAAQLAEHGLPSAALEAQLLLAHAIGRNRAYLLGHEDEVLNTKSEQKANKLLERRLKDEPMAFLLGEREFYGLPIKTDSRALIPRPESEIMVDKAIEWLKAQPDGQIVSEVGTGSGAIILAVAHHCPNHTFYATDVSEEALELARENAIVSEQRAGSSEQGDSKNVMARSEATKQTFSGKGSPRSPHSITKTNLTFLHGDLGEPLIKADLTGKINLLLANLPYIPSDLLTTLDPTITYYEPNLALEGGANGLEIYERFMPQAKQLLAPGGLLLCEHDYDQGEQMRNLAKNTFPQASIKTIQDYLHHDRLLYCALG